MKTKEQIEELKDQWIFDPCWDIETTEGFEEHYEELLKFRLNVKANAEKREAERMKKVAGDLGINFELLKYIHTLEWRIKQLEDGNITD